MSDAETARPHRQAAAPKVTLRRGESAKQPPDLPHGMSADMTKWTTDDHQRFEEHQRRPQLAALGQEPAAAPEPETGIQIIARYVVRVIDPETGRQEITDALGRKLVVQDLDPVEELDLYEA